MGFISHEISPGKSPVVPAPDWALPWTVDDIPAPVAETLREYSRVVGRDPVAVMVVFRDGANSPAALSSARPLPPHVKSAPAAAQSEYRAQQRAGQGWAVLHQQFPLERRRWAAHIMDSGKKQAESRAAAVRIAKQTVKPSNPWSGRVGWEAEPLLPILTKVREGRGRNQESEEVPKEEGYLLYNELVGDHFYRPFRTEGGETRVAVPTGDGLEIGDPSTEDFQKSVGYSVFTVHGEPVPSRDLAVAALALNGRARARALPSERIVRLWLRVAPNGAYSTRVDLVDPQWRCVVLTPEGWRIETTGYPVFDRRRHMKPLPAPEGTADGQPDPSRVEKLWDFVLLPDYPQAAGDDQRLLALAVLVQFLISPGTPKTVVIFPGDEGIGKSSSALRMGQVIDPSSTPKVAVDEDEKELNNLTSNRAVINFDNVSRIDAKFSDYLARTSTGISQAKRMLYSNGDEVIVEMLPQFILNGITAIPHAPDLLRRAVFLNVVPPPATIPVEQLDLQWAAHSPRILAGLFDLACGTLKVLRDDPPQLTAASMADFVRIGQAVAISRGQKAEQFLAAWKANTDRSLAAAAEDPWVGILYDFFALRTVLSAPVKPDEISRWINEHSKHVFPKGVDSQQVGNALARKKTTLAKLGMFVARKVVNGVPMYFRTDGSEIRQESTKQTQLPGLLGGGSPGSPDASGGGVPEVKSGEPRSGTSGEPHPRGSPELVEPPKGGSPEVHPEVHPVSHVSGSFQGEPGEPLFGKSRDKIGGPAPAGPPIEGDESPLTEESFETGPPEAGSGRAASARRAAGPGPGA